MYKLTVKGFGREYALSHRRKIEAECHALILEKQGYTVRISNKKKTYSLK